MAKQRSKGTGTLYRRNPKSPWIAAWFDHDGKRILRSTRTTDRAAAERILAKHVADAALRREGVIDPALDRFGTEARRPLAEQMHAYVAHCVHAGQAPNHVKEKKRQLAALLANSGAMRLGELTSDALVRHLDRIKGQGRAARTINFARQIAVAFLSWCVKTRRCQTNPLSVTPKQDESRDRRRVRRPLTGEELAKLLAVAQVHGREAWYLGAALAGLRKGDLQRLTWADIDFKEGTITIRAGKAKRTDVIPMHPQLAEALKRHRVRPGTAATKPTDRVFPTTVTDMTRLKDFLRAGIARQVLVIGLDGKPVKNGRRSHAKFKTRIVCQDAEGRIIDLHALRTTLGTQLARAGVAPQIAQRIMRHSDYRTTLRHYTVLGLEDTARAVGQLPGIAISSTTEPASTADATKGKRQQPTQKPQPPAHCSRER